MRDALSHRGPDGAGCWTDGGVGLAHRRLSIIDLDGGAQPLSNEDGTVWVTFNGEIYNYRELATNLKRRGHQFRTRSDTEVLVHAYEEFGLDMASRLNGIFGFALYDTRLRRLLLVRDQLGVKPVFYAARDGTIGFGSEIKCVLKGLGIAPQVSQDALFEYLIFRYNAHARTFYEGVERLPPGHLLTWQDGRIEVKRYWAPPAGGQHASLSAAQAVDELDHLLETAVERQLMSDVSLGAFCSGGVDSGLTTAYAAKLTAGTLSTFSVGFADKAWDESDLARNTAARHGTAHNILQAAPAGVNLLKSLIWHNDEPLSHPNSVPLFQLSKFARGSVKVVLTGEGADELLAGYPRHHISRARFMAEVLPAPVRGGIAASLGIAPGHRVSKLAELLPTSLVDSLVLSSAYNSVPLISRLLRSPSDGALANRRSLAKDVLVPGDAIVSITTYDTLTYLGCALDRMDRMSMAVGLEARVPFLDIDVVDWSLRLPSRLRATGARNKVVLKQLASRCLDDRIVHGRKSGFGLPLDDWFRKPLWRPLVERLLDSTHPAIGHFDVRVLGSVVNDHVNGRAQHGELLWVLSNVFLWYEVQAELGAAPPETAMSPAELSNVSV